MKTEASDKDESLEMKRLDSEEEELEMPRSQSIPNMIYNPDSDEY